MKKLICLIIVVLIMAAFAGCNYANRVPALPTYNTITPGNATTVPYGANDPLNVVPPSDYSKGLAPETYIPGGAVGPNTR